MMRRWVVAALLVAVWSASGAGRAAAQATVAALRADLEGVDGERARAAATRLGSIREAAATEALLDALALGLPTDVALAAIDALGAARPRGSIDVLLRYARHRGPDLRAHALAALGGLDDRRARAALLAALGDQDAEVRAAAGQSLAARHDRSALPPLLALLQRGDAAAAAPLAALADAETARTVAELAGKIPDALVAQALGAMLLRPGLGAETTYLSVVRALGAIPGEPSLAALKSFVDSLPEGSRRPSVREARAILDQRAGNPSP